MSPRPRTTSDEEIFAALAAAIAERGPAGVTLTAVGEGCGLSAAALVQRFGSKRGLLLAFAELEAGGVAARFAAARKAEPSPLLAMVEVLAQAVRPAPTPAALSNRLALLQRELADDDFHALALAEAREVASGIRGLIEEAIAAGELVGGDPAGLARTVQTACAGALLTWSLYRQGSAEDWLRDEIEAVLSPYLAP